jgi:asparagine synthetase B (glutamine-hydrolysing)
LSGGVDSSYLQALLLEQQHVHSFSIAFDASGQDNVYAADVARHLGTAHEALTFTADEFLQCIERGIKVTGKPYMYQGEAMFLKLYGHIATRFPKTTIISGQTADGALDSAIPRPIRLALQLQRMPHQLLDQALSYITDEWRGLAAELQALPISSENLRRIERRSGTCQRVARYLGCSHDVYAQIAVMTNDFPGSKEDKLAKSHLYNGEMRRIPNMLHALAESVGSRLAFPFLEPGFLEYTLTIPAKLKRGKYLGKKLAERHISRRYVYRPKISKGIPYGKLFTQERQWVDVLNTIKEAAYYGFDVDELINSQEYPLLLRLINFHIWKLRVLDSA